MRKLKAEKDRNLEFLVFSKIMDISKRLNHLDIVQEYIEALKVKKFKNPLILVCLKGQFEVIKVQVLI